MKFFETKRQKFGLFAATAVIAGAAATFAARAWINRGTYICRKTLFGRARIYQVEGDDGASVRLLEVAKTVQSGTYIDHRYTELVFEYEKLFARALDRIPTDVRHVFVGGCGGFDLPKYLIAHFPRMRITAVEIDPAIISIAHNLFFLDRLEEEYSAQEQSRLDIVCADCLAHMISSNDVYDAILCDCFAGDKPGSLPWLTSFVRCSKDHLNERGIFCINVVSALQGPEAAALREVKTVLGDEFEHVEVIPCSVDAPTEKDNIVVVAHNA